MAELTPKTINELPELTAPTDATLFACSASSASKKITWATIKNKLLAALSPIGIPNGGTDATTAAGARANLGLNGRMAANQISDGASYTLNVPGNARFVLFLTSLNSVGRRILIVASTTAGLVNFSDTYTGASDQVTITKDTNRLSITNNSGSYVYTEILSFGNSPMPTEVTP